VLLAQKITNDLGCISLEDAHIINKNKNDIVWTTHIVGENLWWLQFDTPIF